MTLRKILVHPQDKVEREEVSGCVTEQILRLRDAVRLTD